MEFLGWVAAIVALILAFKNRGRLVELQEQVKLLTQEAERLRRHLEGLTKEVEVLHRHAAAPARPAPVPAFLPARLRGVRARARGHSG